MQRYKFILNKKTFPPRTFPPTSIFINMKYKIYKLIDPITNEIRYVGRTIQTLENRLKKHLKAEDKSHRVNWIKSLSAKDLQPKIELICETTTFEDCCELESFYINKYKNEGMRLVNMTDGGDGSIGFKHTEETILKLKEIAKQRAKNNQYINTLKEYGLKQWENKTENEKLLNKLNQKGRRNIKQFTLDGIFVKEFISLREIERELGYFRANITPCLKGEFKQAYNFIWKYSDET
jgi:group I intron endonuclease